MGIVAISSSGNVYSFEAINELNLKTDCMRDIITAENFKRNDIITLQQTKKNNKWSSCSRIIKYALTSNKNYVKSYQIYCHNMNNSSLSTKKELKCYNSPEFIYEYYQKKNSVSAISTYETLKKFSNYLPKTGIITQNSSRCGTYLDSRPGASTWNSDLPNKKRQNFGCVYQQFLISLREFLMERLKYEAMKNVQTKTPNGLTSIIMTDQILPGSLFNRIPQYQYKKGYVQLVTSHMNINLELHSDIEPVICENFLISCETGQYDGINLNMSYKNSAIQGHSRKTLYPRTACKLESPHANSFNRTPKKSKFGTLRSNFDGSQFLIALKHVQNLDDKNYVFGRVVGGLENLTLMAKILINLDNMPIQEIKIIKTKIFLDPFLEESMKSKQKFS